MSFNRKWYIWCWVLNNKAEHNKKFKETTFFHAKYSLKPRIFVVTTQYMWFLQKIRKYRVHYLMGMRLPWKDCHGDLVKDGKSWEMKLCWLQNSNTTILLDFLVAALIEMKKCWFMSLCLIKAWIFSFLVCILQSLNSLKYDPIS